MPCTYLRTKYTYVKYKISLLSALFYSQVHTILNELNNKFNSTDKEVDIDKETLSMYDIKGKEKTSSTSEKKEKERDGYVYMYECGKYLLHSSYDHAYAEDETTINQMKEIMEIFNSEIEEILSTNWDTRNYIDIFRKKS